MTSVQTPTLAMNLHYDAVDRVISRQYLRGEQERVLRYQYNKQGQRETLTLAARESGTEEYRLLQQTGYSYEAGGRLSQLRGNGRVICDYQYQPRTGRLAGRAYSNGMKASCKYDACASRPGSWAAPTLVMVKSSARAATAT